MTADPRRLLALDTATENCSAALWVDGDLSLRAHLSTRDHASLLLGMVDELLNEAGLRLDALDCLAFGRGPGGFTGVRIATSVVQGLALGAALPVVPVSDLEALAWRAWQRHGWQQVLVAMDARMGELYTLDCRFDAAGALRSVGRERLLAPAALGLPEGSWAGAGPGWAAHAEALAPLRERLYGLDAAIFPDAGAVASLAIARLRAGHAAVDAGGAEPVYLRDSVAHPQKGSRP
jgi:tRNA threonylcarbamoyladenosine biosynthesis protein TsaB